MSDLLEEPDLRIFVYTVCWNEAKFLPYFLRHYATFAEKIIVYDNGSTDASCDIVRAFPQAELRQFDTGGTFDDLANVAIKNEAYKEVRGVADFVIVVDADELLYHPDIKRLLHQYKRDGVSLPRIDGYNMFAWKFPQAARPITELVRYGRSAPWYGKRIIFRPDVDINYNPCCHICHPQGPVVESPSAELKLLHYHYMGYLYNLRKHRERGRRLSQYNLKRNLGIEYHWGFMRIFARFVVFMANSNDVVRGKRSVFATLCGAPVNWLKALLVKAPRA
ncbi:MAG: glycosyltransferase family 2 protein [Verrucomicrobiota bacterium]